MLSPVFSAFTPVEQQHNIWQGHTHVLTPPLVHVATVQVLLCYHPEDGGFGASPRNDSHMLATLSALQILALLDELHRVDTDKVVACELPCATGHWLISPFSRTYLPAQQYIIKCQGSLFGRAPHCHPSSDCYSLLAS